LELAIQDVFDPNNPEYHDPDPPHRPNRRSDIVVDSHTVKLEESRAEEALDHLVEDRRLSKELAGNCKQRNSGKPIQTSLLKLSKKNIKIVDLDALFIEGGNNPFSFHTLFNERYPNSAGYVQPCLPGYTPDGLYAVVVLDAGPSPHGAAWVYLMALREGRWKILWRRLNVFE
jgi:hypothetical protein